jgi:hypothetical protein
MAILTLLCLSKAALLLQGFANDKQVIVISWAFFTSYLLEFRSIEACFLPIQACLASINKHSDMTTDDYISITTV